MKKIGIIAGNGALPLNLISNLKDTSVFAILIKNEAQEENYKNLNIKYITLPIGKAEKALDYFRKNNVKNIVFAGGVKKKASLSAKTDKKGGELLLKILKSKILGDDTILRTVIKFFEREGFKVLSASDICKDALTPKGNIGNNVADEQAMDDIKFGTNILKSLSKYDIGQSIVIQQGIVLGIECIEGTDALINRCAKLKLEQGSKPVLIKMSKIQQTKRIDLPSIGVDTVDNLIKADFAGIALQAKNSFILDKDATIKKIDKSSLFLMGLV